MSGGGRGGGLAVNFNKSQLQITKSNPELKFQFLGGGEEGGWGGGRIGHGMHGIWCCHLACIWGELADFDTKFCNTFIASASQIVPFRN